MINSHCPIHTVGIVGLGLIGGSMARAVRAGTDCRILCADKNTCVLERAAADGVMDGMLTQTNVSECDLLLLALYPGAAVEWLDAYAGDVGPGAIVTDCCGVKRVVAPALSAIAEKNGFFYVGGHPMAGTEKSGYSASRADLFTGASMILMQAPDSIRGRLSAFFLSIGFGSIKWSTPEEHDRIIAYTSQLAHVLSSAYVKSPSALTHNGFSAGSFQDMTRVAYLNEKLWTELFMDNADYLAEEIEGLSARLLKYAAAIRGRQREELCELLAEGRRCKELTEKQTMVR